jgi:hypothetical protein
MIGASLSAVVVYFATWGILVVTGIGAVVVAGYTLVSSLPLVMGLIAFGFALGNAD